MFYLQGVDPSYTLQMRWAIVGKGGEGKLDKQGGICLEKRDGALHSCSKSPMTWGQQANIGLRGLRESSPFCAGEEKNCTKLMHHVEVILRAGLVKKYWMRGIRGQIHWVYSLSLPNIICTMMNEKTNSVFKHAVPL